MSETLTKLVVDCSTGIQTIVPLTSEEIAQREAEAAANAETASAEVEVASEEVAEEAAPEASAEETTNE